VLRQSRARIEVLDRPSRPRPRCPFGRRLCDLAVTGFRLRMGPAREFRDTVPLAPAPDWLWPPKPSRPSVPKGPLRPVQGLGPYGTATIEAACKAIVSAPPGEQESVLNAESYSVGTAVGAGLIPSGIALRALLSAAATMPDHDPRHPWPGGNRFQGPPCLCG